MEIKTILDKIQTSDNQTPETMLALLIISNQVKSALWSVADGQVRIIALGETKDWQTESEISAATDLSIANFQLTNQVKVILGLPTSWIEENKIKSEKLNFLRQLSKDLNIQAVGFVTLPEAIVHHLKNLEGIPLTAILVNKNDQQLTVTLVKLGKIIGSQLVNLSPDLGADLVEGLSRFGQEEAFPPRIILLGKAMESETAKQILTAYAWEKTNLNFLHLPKIEILPADFDIQSVALAGGREISQAEGLTEENFGFVKNQDIQTVTPAPLVSQPPVAPEPLPVTPPLVKTKFQFPLPSLPKLNWGNLNIFKKRSFKIPQSKFGWLIGLIAAGLILLLVLAVLFWWRFPKAQINLFVKTQNLEKDFQLKLDPNISTPDINNLTFPAQTVETELTGNKTGQTIGTKLIGDAAKGTVTIYNGLGTEKTLTTGTILTSSSGLKFTLDEEIQLASRSSAADPTPTTNAKVTAEKIGADYNLASGSEFSLADFPKTSYVAKNEEAFSGGTSREVQVVAQKDQDDLLASLTEELKNQASQELANKISGEQKLVDGSISLAVVEKTFDKKVDEEADQVNLQLKIKFFGLSYNQEEFKQAIADIIKQAIPSGYEYKAEESQVSFSYLKTTKDKKALYQAHFQANLLPQLDLEAIKKNLQGKQLAIGQDYLNSLPLVEAFDIKISPQFPKSLATFPHLLKKINLELSVKD